MWIAATFIVLILLGGMGINMLIHRDTGTGLIEISSPSRTVPANQRGLPRLRNL
jgi:hypothetical protein